MKRFKHKETGAVIEVDDNVATAMERFGFVEIEEDKKGRKKEE